MAWGRERLARATWRQKIRILVVGDVVLLMKEEGSLQRCC